MHKLLVLSLCLAAGAAEARQFIPARLAPYQQMDTEVVTNIQYSLDIQALRRYSITLELYGTPSNNLEVAIGTDSNRDGALSFDERGLWLAWDCGEWFFGGMGDDGWEMSDLPIVTGGPDSNGVVCATVEIGVRRHKSNPGWMYSDTWDTLRVTARGVDAPLENVCLKTETSGTRIIVR